MEVAEEEKAQGEEEKERHTYTHKSGKKKKKKSSDRRQSFLLHATQKYSHKNLNSCAQVPVS